MTDVWFNNNTITIKAFNNFFTIKNTNKAKTINKKMTDAFIGVFICAFCGGGCFFVVDGLMID